MIKQSYIFNWFFKRPFPRPLFRESRVIQFISKGISRFSFVKTTSFQEGILFTGKWILLALLLSCIFIPRFYVGSVASFYRVDLRMEDIFLAALSILVLGIMIEEKRSIASVEQAFLLFLFACQVSILNGIFSRTIDKPLISFFYLLKWVEYLTLFIVTTWLTKSSKESSFFLKTFFILGIAVACYGYWEHFFPFSKAVYPNYYRLFERPPFHGDANHIGGFLVLWMGFFTGLYLTTESRLGRALLFASLLFVFITLIWTYSRKSYFALAGVFIFSFLFRGCRRKLIWLVCFLIVFGLLLPTRLAERLVDLGEVFGSVDPFHSSWAGNLVMWKEALWNFDHFFLFGSGLGARHRLFYESQYMLVLSETGVLGMTAFFFSCLALLRGIACFLSRSLAPKDRGIALGWLLGFVGLLIHSFSCVSWTVSKIAIPFWFLTAFVFAHLERGQAALTSAALDIPSDITMKSRAGNYCLSPFKSGGSS